MGETQQKTKLTKGKESSKVFKLSKVKFDFSMILNKVFLKTATLILNLTIKKSLKRSKLFDPVIDELKKNYFTLVKFNRKAIACSESLYFMGSFESSLK